MSERATYHHGDLRQALIAAAVDLISAKGVAGLSVAEAARKAGVSGAAPYRHFASRTALLSAAATALATDLLEHLQVTAAGGPARGVPTVARGVPLAPALAVPHAADPTDVAAAIDSLAQLTRARIDFALGRGVGLELVYAEELRTFDDPQRRDVTRRLFELYLWPAMTVTGDAVAAGRLLRQAAALAQGYLDIARSNNAVAGTTEAAELADEAAAAVRVLAHAAQDRRGTVASDRQEGRKV